MALTQISSAGIKNAEVKTEDILDNAVTGAKVADNLDIPDNNKIRFGTGNDLQIYHDGSDSWIKHDGDGSLYLNAAGTSEDIYIRAADNVYIQNQTSDAAITAIGNGQVELYYDGSKKLNTRSNGIDVTGDIYPSGHIALQDSMKVLWGAGDDLQIYHDASNSYLANTTGSLIVSTVTGAVSIQKSSAEYLGRFIVDGAVELYYDNSKKLQTYSNGTEILGNLWLQNGGAYHSDNVKYHFGNSEDLQIYHNGSNSYIDNTTGTLHIRDDSVIHFASTANEDLAKFTANGSVELYYDNSKKLETITDGVQVTGKLDVTGSIYFGSNNNGRIYTDANWGTIFQGDAASPNVAEFMWQNAGDTERLRIDNSGNLKIIDGDLIIGTAGHGIDFSATSSNGSSELLDDYEEGTYTQTISNLGDHTKENDSRASYIKIGNQVTTYFFYKWTSRSTTNGGYSVAVTLPFTAANIKDVGHGSLGWEGVRPHSSSNTSAHCSVNQNSASVTFRCSGDNVNEVSFNGANSTSISSGYVQGVVCYQAA